jgi:hypothetical protein
MEIPHGLDVDAFAAVEQTAIVDYIPGLSPETRRSPAMATK